MTTKERIIDEAMKLFSTNGYDSVSIRTIAKEVGVTNSALYKHFKSKQDIFDAIVETSKERYLNRCNIVNSDIRGANQVKEICIEMFQYQISDPWIVMFRRILLMEQFKNPEMGKIFRDFFVEIPLKKQENIFRELIKNGFMQDKDPRVMALEMYSPFFMFHIARHSEEEDEELLRQFGLHAQYFFDNYVVEKET